METITPLSEAASRQQVQGMYARLGLMMRDAPDAESPNRELFRRMLASWRSGAGWLPDCMGMSRDDYSRMLDRYFPTAQWPPQAVSGIRLDAERQPEGGDLRQLLLEYRAGADIAETWLADILVAACMGGNHLWQDLGLWCRGDLSELMSRNFPALAQLNDRDMKWKKFLYKQLCAREGIYVCRSPSCEVCVDYPVCFGPEE